MVAVNGKIGKKYDLWHKYFPREIGANSGLTNVYNRFLCGLAHHLTHHVNRPIIPAYLGTSHVRC